jgi:hypothetical protein
MERTLTHWLHSEAIPQFPLVAATQAQSLPYPQNQNHCSHPFSRFLNSLWISFLDQSHSIHVSVSFVLFLPLMLSNFIPLWSERNLV